jgi:hypothetical protein
MSEERALHNALCKRAESVLSVIERSWYDKKKIDPCLVGWVSDPVPTADGKVITDVIHLDLTGAEKEVENFMDVVQPCAILMAKETAKHVQVVFETPIGTTSWTYPKEKSGGVTVLGRKLRKADEDSTGLLWLREQALED